MLERALALSLLVLCASCMRRDPEPQNRVILRVNDESLKATDFANLLKDKLKSLSAFSVKDPRNVTKAKGDVVSEFIIKVVTETYAATEKIYVSKDELEAETNKVIKNYGDETSFRNALVREGMTLPEWQKKLRFSLLEKKVTEKVTASASKPSEAELKAYYNENLDEFTTPEEVRIRQIVVDSESAAKQIQTALNEKKKKFEDLAKEYSMTPESEQGGDLGWVRRGTSEIFDAAFGYTVGYRTDILKSPYGYHIFEVTDKRKPQKQEFAAVKDRIERQFLVERQQSIYSAWLEKQIQRTRVFKDQKLIDSISVDLSGS